MLSITRRLHKEEGFTLIELLIVIVVLGVLAGIVVFAVSGITDDSQTSACRTELRTAETAVEAYYADASPRAYPTPSATNRGWDPLTAGGGKFLRSAPQNYVLGAGGAITPLPANDGGDCVGITA